MHDIYNDPRPVRLAQELIKCPSVTPEDHGALDLLQHWLEQLDFTCTRLVFADEGLAPVDNLYARRGTSLPNLCFAGHTDVVPTGDEGSWTLPPFEGIEKDGFLWGRGAADMKGAIGSWLSALVAYLEKESPSGSISLLITGDEEGAAINGTKKVLEWMAEQGEEISHCVIGEPSNPKKMGEMIKVGRRGSYNAYLTVYGTQGHVAYPQRADNPLPKLLTLVSALIDTPLDDGYQHFQASNLELSAITTPALAENVIPGEATARFNVRFNPNWSEHTLDAHLRDRLEKAAKEQINWSLKGRASGEAFLGTDQNFADLIAKIVTEHTGLKPELSASGGTSDGRFIHHFSPVAEFGLVGATMHKIDERIAINDMDVLRDIYLHLLREYFKPS